MHYVAFVVSELMICGFLGVFFFQAEDGIRDLVRSRGLGDVYKRQFVYFAHVTQAPKSHRAKRATEPSNKNLAKEKLMDLSLIHI